MLDMKQTEKYSGNELVNLVDVAHFLIRKSSLYDDIEMYNEAVRLIGQENVTRYKLDNNLELWQADFDSFYERLDRLERILSH